MADDFDIKRRVHSAQVETKDKNRWDVNLYEPAQSLTHISKKNTNNWLCTENRRLRTLSVFGITSFRGQSGDFITKSKLNTWRKPQQSLVRY